MVISSEDIHIVLDAINEALDHYVECNCGKPCRGTCTRTSLERAVLILKRAGTSPVVPKAPEMLEMLKFLYSEMERGHSINPYEYKARVGDLIRDAS